MQKLMKIIKNGNQFLIEDNQDRFVVPEEFYSNVTEGEMWLIDIGSRDLELVVKSLKDTLTVYTDGKFTKYTYNSPEVDITKEHESNKTEKEHESDLYKDLAETKDIMQDSYNTKEKSFTLQSGKNITIKCSIQGNQVIRYSKEMDYTHIAPMSLKVVKEMININGSAEYNPDLGQLRIDDNTTIEVNDADLMQIFDDLQLVVTPLENTQVMGSYKSSQLIVDKPRYVADYPGGYIIEAQGSEGHLILPNFDWKGNDDLRSITQYNMSNVTYDQFKHCLTDHIRSKIDSFSTQEVLELINVSCSNFNGSAINLTVFDKIDLKQQLEKDYGIDLGHCPEKELSAF